MMIRSLLEMMLPQIKAVRWIPVVGYAVLAVLVFFAIRYVWDGRPREFYQDGLRDGAATEKALCDEKRHQEQERNQRMIEDENKKREKILSRPHSPPSALLERMRRGEL